MGVEVVVASDVAAQAPLETVTEVGKSILHDKENGKLDKESGPNEAIKFGSHEREAEKGVGTDVADAIARRNASHEWPDHNIHEFHLIRIPLYYDPKYQPQLEELDKQISKKNDELNPYYDRLRALRGIRSELYAELKDLKTQGYEFRDILSKKREELQPLQQALGQLRNNNNGAGRGGICSSEEELDEMIKRLEYRIQHESIPLSEEKQIIREIKQLQSTRPDVIANAEARAKIQEKLGQKDAIQDQVKHMNVDYDGVRKEHDAIFDKINALKAKIEALEKEIKVIEEQLAAVKLKKDELYDRLRKVRDQSEQGNASHFANRTYLARVKNLAVKKDIQAIQQLVNAETDKFMLAWCNDKAFRDDYKRRVTARKQPSQDGRMRNPDEKHITVVERPPPSQAEQVVKLVKKPEESQPAPKKESGPAKKVQKKMEEVEEEVAGLEKTQQKTPPPQVDVAKLKEMKREEEIAKAKLAMERKKKLAEKAAAKAAKRAEKEAEKKLKDREKKLKKKTGGSGQTNEDEKASEEAMEGSEPDETKEVVAAAVPVKEQVKRENPVRYRNRPRGPESVPRALLKKKKSTNYWLWAAPAAVVAVLMVFLAYYYLL